MTRDDIIKIAKEAWLRRTGCVWTEPKCWSKAELVRFAELISAAEREKVAQWMMQRGYATGHDNTIEGLLQEFDWQIRERERALCANMTFNLGNAVKYIWRSSLKGKQLEDLHKARWYIDREIQRLAPTSPQEKSDPCRQDTAAEESKPDQEMLRGVLDEN